MVDYIFYRVYWAYKRKGEAARVLSLLYVAMVIAFLLFPFAMFLCELLRDSWHKNDGCLYFVYLLTVLIYSCFRFFPGKKICLINRKYDKSHYNNTIPNWCFFAILPLSVVWGIIAYSLVVKLLVKPFALEGIVYNMLQAGWESVRI